MSVVLTCTEASALPPRVSLPLEAGQAVVVALLPEEPADSLRQTLIRPAEELLPLGSTLLFEAELVEGGRAPVLRVRRVGALAVEVLRPEGRLRLNQNAELRSGVRLEATTAERRSVGFGLLWSQVGAAGARAAAGGGGSRASAAMAAQTTLLWVVPGIFKLVRDPLDDILDGLFEAVAKSGISPRTFSAILIGLMTLMVTGGLGVFQYLEAKEAKAELAASQEALAGAQASKEAALVAEAQCLVDRRSLADQLQSREAAQRAAAELALAATAARAVAVERGGRMYQAEELGRSDAEALELDLRAVITQMGDMAEGVEGAARCRGLASTLGQDLPPLTLEFHTDPTLWCPAGYLAVMGQSELRGSWGLSSRVAEEFAEVAGLNAETAMSSVEGFDPRDVDRLSAGLLTAGLRSVRAALLSPARGPRPVMAPAETHLWSLALFAAANRLPKAAPGGSGAPIGECVGALVDQLAATQRTASPAEPVLPPLARVARGDVILPATATAACPWPEGAVAAGASAALAAASRAAAVASTPPNPE